MNEINKHKSSVLKSHRDVIYSIRDIVNDTVMTLYEDRWLLGLSWCHFIMYGNIKSLCSTPGTNIISQLYFKE